ncbi:MAG: tRNA pseudouridine(55) synthase TruB [Elusimicrobia bacterium]|nr:tRNA pseudouridine(55) synthase TruB [Elusimicrobiota bacterium]
MFEQQNNFSGLLLVNKPSGITSFKVVSIIRKTLKVKKVGHCGTLDPLAVGLMIVLVGKSATKQQDKFMKQDKVYYAKIKLGIKTDTGDLEGQIISQSDFSNITLEQIKSVCNSFIGETEQEPPMYSALKVNGKKLYELARKGITVERKKRKITIYNIDILSFNGNEIEIRVKCSSGTYIRVLAQDIGAKLNTDATLSYLRREQIGPFSLDNAVSLENITPENLIAL